MNQSRYFFERLEHAGRSFRVDERNELETLFCQRGAELRWIERRPPFRFNRIHLRAATLSNVHHPGAEHPVDADEDRIAGLKEVDEAGLHARAAGAGHGQGKAVFGLKQFAQHSHALVHDLEKRESIEMTHDGQRQSSEARADSRDSDPVRVGCARVV